MRYRVKILEPDAGIGTVVLEAANAAEAARQAAAGGRAVLSVARAPLGAGLSGASTGRFPLLLFSQELLALLDSGISMVEAIETLSEKESRPAVTAILGGVLAGLREGQPLSAVLEAQPQAFPPLYVATVRAAERTSNLAEALGRYIAYASQLDALRGRLQSAAIYPALLIGVGGLVILFLLGYVVPRFSHIYEDMGSGLPLMSHLLLAWGRAVERYWPLMLCAAAVVVAAILRGGFPARMARLALRIPALGERLRVFELARLYRTLGMLLRGGIAIVPALEMSAGLLSGVLRLRLSGAIARIREGSPLSLAFGDAGLVTPVAQRMMRVGERAGNMGEMLERAASFHDEEIARWAEWVTRLFGPLLMLLMGLVIGFIVVLMYLPIFQLAESLG